jgi:photosystem II stability/assembly factor-like uncharacterized protein
LWSDSEERGLFKTTDGGKTWNNVLKGPNLSTGASDIAMDPTNPDIMFASLWDFRRQGWTFRSGGNGPDAPSGSGLFRTADGGATWTELTPEANKGFPKKPYGRIAVAIAPSNAKRVYAFVEGTDSALFVSDDGGATWEKRDKSTWMVWRPFYFAKLVVDPKNADKVFKMNGAMIVSEDAGKSFSVVGGFQGMHGDVHDLWVDPTNTQTVIAGDDGGMYYSYNGGSKWWKGENLPLSQFYHVSVDDADPYRVYGGLQDNSSWVGDTQYPGGITNSRWENMYGGDGFWMFSDPADPDYLYAEYQGGFVARVNRHTKEARSIQPKPNYKEKLRWNWNTPIHLSPNEKGTIYVGAQFLFRSRNQGQSWDRISPDLTTNDPEKQQQEKSGGITVDNSAAEMHTTIYSISESPKDKNTIWVGTDDGNLQVTRDGGKPGQTWSATSPACQRTRGSVGCRRATSTPARLTRPSIGTRLATWPRMPTAPTTSARPGRRSRRRRTRRRFAATRTSSKKTWRRRICSSSDRVRALRLGRCGQELGAVQGQALPERRGARSRDSPARKRSRARHARRGIWIVDDITPLRGLTADLLKQEASFVSARPVQQRLEGQGGWANGDAVFVGENPPDAAVITYYQRSRHLFGKLKIEVLDASVEWSTRSRRASAPA